MNKVKRNDPCPCGSTKKWKKCCGQVKQTAFRATSTPSSSQNHKLQKLFHTQITQ